MCARVQYVSSHFSFSSLHFPSCAKWNKVLFDKQVLLRSVIVFDYAKKRGPYGPEGSRYLTNLEPAPTWSQLFEPNPTTEIIIYGKVQKSADKNTVFGLWCFTFSSSGLCTGDPDPVPSMSTLPLTHTSLITWTT